jgi:mannose-6-phosphate isomerase
VPGHDHLTSPNLRGVDRFATEQRTVDKPWGNELIFAVTEDYAGKLLFLKAGESISLQFHKVKDEAWFVLEGRGELELGAPGEGVLSSEIVGPGSSFRFPPGTVHRLKAIEDTRIIEVSTPQLDDVVRLEDRYGREKRSDAKP